MIIEYLRDMIEIFARARTLRTQDHECDSLNSTCTLHLQNTNKSEIQDAAFHILFVNRHDVEPYN